MKILITGGCGFVGSNLAIYFKDNRIGTQINSLDNLSRRGTLLNFNRLKKKETRTPQGALSSVRSTPGLCWDYFPHSDCNPVQGVSHRSGSGWKTFRDVGVFSKVRPRLVQLHFGVSAVEVKNLDFL